MIFRLQHYGFDQSKYDRPNQKWVCGWARDGKSCHVGPDGKGNCIAAHECIPIRNQDRWACSRAKEFGGRCLAGPLPDGTCCNAIPRCQPVLSVRAKRGAVAKWASFFVLGLVLMFSAGPSGPNFISPGGLTSQHQETAQSCGNCHSDFKGGPVKWMRAAFVSTRSPQGESRLCLSCHIFGGSSGMPHSFSEKKLIQISQSIKAKGMVDSASVEMDLADMLSLNGERKPGKFVACATCHQEHRGRNANLAAMNNLRCQSCHVVRFTSFERDHPEFSNFPYDRRTRLVFDHSRHLNKHFAGKMKERAPKSCKSCHLPDASGTLMTVRPFKVACAACHEGQILGEGSAGSKGIPFIALPGLDAESLQEAKIDIGHWPQDAEEEGLPPFMRFLLSGDPKFRKAAASLKGADLLDLSKANAAVKSAAGEFAWAIKRLVFDLAVNGQKTLKSRLENILRRRLSAAEFSRLSGQIPAGVLRSSQKKWFPRLSSEISLRKKGKKPGSKKKDPEEKESESKDEEPEELPSAEDISVAGGWYVQDFSVYYRPSGHEDRFLKDWMDLVAGGDGSKEAMKGMFAALSDPKATGYCAKCHSIDRVSGKARRVNWRARRSASDVKKFIRYQHTPHFSLLDEKGCLTCHRLNANADYLKGFKDDNPATFTSNFRPIAKKVCASCHTRVGASNSCLTCHNYHVGKVVPARTSARMRMPENLNNP
ncbi:MAG TPA: hypothetical protein DDZ83_01770 [Nitrospinae bacterium]|nr:hypothetical protein [Nitrospinota bacterium]